MNFILVASVVGVAIGCAGAHNVYNLNKGESETINEARGSRRNENVFNLAPDSKPMVECWSSRHVRVHFGDDSGETFSGGSRGQTLFSVSYPEEVRRVEVERPIRGRFSALNCKVTAM